MGKIPQYQREKFVSSYVGSPQMDTSEAEMVAGISKAAGTVIDIEAKKMQEKANRIIDAQAEKALLDYSLAYQRQVKGLEAQYADNPEQFPTAVSAMGEQLMGEYIKNIKDERIAARFGGAANTVIRQSQAGALKWAEVKQEENAVIAAQDVARIAALTTGQTTDVVAFKNNWQAAEARIQALPEVSRAKQRALMPEMFESHLYHRAETEPDKLEADLNDPKGPYAKMEYFTDEMKRKMLGAIKSERRYQKKVIDDAQDNNYARFIDLVTEGNLTLAQLDSAMASDSPLDKVADRDYSRLKEQIFDKIRVDATALYKSEPDSKKFVDIAKAVTSRRDRSKLLSEILDVWKDGSASPEEIKYLTELTRPHKTAADATRWQNTGKGINRIAETVGRYVGNSISDVATAMRAFISGVAGGGDIDETADKVIKNAQRDAIVRNNTTLATSKDPVDDAYRNQAIAALNAAGRVVDENAIQRILSQLKQKER